MSALDAFRARLPAYLAELRELVAIETPTGDEANATRAAAWLGERLAPFGELELQDLDAGTTVGPNVIAAGSASNVVPDLARMKIDVRAWTVAEQRRIDAGIAALTPVLDGARLELGGGWNRPPMEASPASMALFERARRIGVGLGCDLKPAR